MASMTEDLNFQFNLILDFNGHMWLVNVHMGQHLGKELSQCTHKIPQMGMNSQGNFRFFVPAPFLLSGPPQIV